MLPHGSRVIAAVSGGADSVCLLHVLKELAPDSLAGIAHFNHKWRAEASEDDERFVVGLASQFALPFFRAEARAEGSGNREQNARRERHAFFRSLPHKVALGHTADDQAETVLFRFLRGSGLTGLAGMDPVAEGIIRPLIDIARADVEEYLRARNIAWREDATNADVSFSRNRIRHDLLPELASGWNPQIRRSLAQLAGLARDEESYWMAELDRLAPTCMTILPPVDPSSALPDVEFRTDALASLPKAVARRLIRRAIALSKGDLRRIDYQHVEAVFELQRRLVLPGLTVTRSFEWLQFSSSPEMPDPPSQIITPPGVYPSRTVSRGSASISLRLRKPPRNRPQKPVLR